MANHYFRDGAGDEARVVMLGEPIARVTKLVGELREIDSMSEGLSARRAG